MAYRIITATIILVLLSYVRGQAEKCKDVSPEPLCKAYKQDGKCNETMVITRCAKTCDICTPATTTQAVTTMNLTTTERLVTTSNTTSNNLTTAAATKSPETSAPTTAPSTKGKVTSGVTASTQPTTTTSTTTANASTTTIPIPIRQVRKAVKADVVDDQGYNMNLTILFLGHVNMTIEQQGIEAAVVAALAKYGVMVNQSMVTDVHLGVSKSNRATTLTSVTWKLKVDEDGKTVTEMVDELNSDPTVAFEIKTRLAPSVETTLYGKDDFIDKIGPTTTSTTAKPTIKKESKFEVSHWNYIGIAIGASLALILIAVITGVVQRRKNKGKKTMKVAEGSYDFEVSIGPNNNVDSAVTKTQL